jgi:hypothetical protein
VEADLLAGDLPPGVTALVERPDGGEALRAEFRVCATAGEVVDDVDVVPAGRQVQ